MKTIIAVPCMDSVASGFAQSLACLNKIGECNVRFQVGSLIYHSRNQLAREAISGGFDYVLWLDSDLIFNPDIMERMMADLERPEVDIVTGIYYRRVAPYSPTIFKEGEKQIETYEDYPHDDLFEIAACGFGCVMFKTGILADIVMQQGNWFEPMNGAGEDIAFCTRARLSGLKIFADPKIQLGHLGHIYITEQFFETVRKQQ